MKGSGLVMGGVIGGCVGLILSGVWFVAGAIVGFELDRQIHSLEGANEDA